MKKHLRPQKLKGLTGPLSLLRCKFRLLLQAVKKGVFVEERQTPDRFLREKPHESLNPLHVRVLQLRSATLRSVRGPDGL